MVHNLKELYLQVKVLLVDLQLIIVFSDNNGQIFISGSPAVGGTHHPKFMFISSSNFNVKQSGDITGSSALFNGNTSMVVEL